MVVNQQYLEDKILMFNTPFVSVFRPAFYIPWFMIALHKKCHLSIRMYSTETLPIVK